MILTNHRITIREVDDDVGIQFGSGQEIFADILDMKCTELWKNSIMDFAPAHTWPKTKP